MATIEHNGCDILSGIKDDIFNIIKSSNDVINDNTSTIGDYERLFTHRNPQPKSIINPKTASISNSIKLIKPKLNGLIFSWGDNQSKIIITKKYKGVNGLIETHYNIETNLFGTGNLTPTLLLSIKYENGSQQYTDIIAKVFPVDFFEIRKHDNTYTAFDTLAKQKQLNNFMYFTFIREAQIGCWIKNILIVPKISGTFGYINDAYLLKGLPISYHMFVQQKWQTPAKYNKRWLTDLAIDQTIWDISKSAHFGLIEMEKLDNTLFDEITTKLSLDLGIFFEILYTKLVMMFYGNVYMADDHANNIMVKYTKNIRHYQIIRRNTVYNFYVDNATHIKYIDFERFLVVENRNEFLDFNTDLFFQYFEQQNYYQYFSDSDDREIATCLIKQLKNKSVATVDNFCELMHKFMPESFRDDQFYINLARSKNVEIVTYTINLDIDESVLENGFLLKDHTTKIIKPFSIQKLQTAGGYYNKFEKYSKKFEDESRKIIY